MFNLFKKEKEIIPVDSIIMDMSHKYGTSWVVILSVMLVIAS